MSAELRKLGLQVALGILAVNLGYAGTAQWDLNGSLGSTAGQAALEAAGYPGVATAPGVTFEDSTIGGRTAQVAHITKGTALAVRHGFPANGGGGYLNLYTLVLDVKFPVIDWTSIYQTNEAYDDAGAKFDLSDSNDGDWFMNPSGALGIEGNYGGALAADTWYRLALVVNLASGTYTIYVNGTQVQQNTGAGLDGRYAIYTPSNPDPYTWFLLFADETGSAAEMGEVYLNSFQFRDEALTAEQVAALGGPTAAGIPSLPPACGVDYFSESFDGVDDAMLDGTGWQRVDVGGALENATWTTTNPGGRVNPPGLNGTRSSSTFIISDSDAADAGNNAGTGMSHDLVTPAFSTLGGASVWLHASCSAQLNNDGDAVFDVDVSTDGGGIWTNAFRRVSPGRTLAPAADTTNADGFFGRLSLDLSTLAANQASVRIRFRHFEPTDDWWVALDDIRVSCEPAPQPGNCTVLAKQTFASGLGAMQAVSSVGNAAPATWGTTDVANLYVAGSANVASGRGIHRVNQPSATKEFAVIETAAAATEFDEYLLTPALNCSAFNDVVLSYKDEMMIKGTTTYEVLLSLDGGATYSSTIFSYNNTLSANNALFDDEEESFYAARSFSIPSAAGKENVLIAFHLKGPKDAQNRRFWALDDVEVTGRAAECDPRDCGLRNFAVAYDAGTNKVTGTWKSLPGDTGFSVVQAGRVVVSGLPASAVSFVDAAPPVGGTGIQYTLQCGDRDCVSSEISTYACLSALSARPNQVAKTVKLDWSPGVNLGTTGYSLKRNGVEIASLPLTTATFTDTPALAAGEPGVLVYDLSVVGANAEGCNALSSRAIVSPGSVCFADDFEDYADDVAFELAGWFRVDEVPNPATRPGEEATWTVTNPGNRATPPTFDGKPSAGRFAISDSDDAGGDNGAPGSGNSNDLWSPSFSTTGKSVVWLHMDASIQLNNNGKVVVDVDVSTDGGVTWSNVYRRVAPQRTEAAPIVDRTNADGFFGRLDVDLSALAANKPGVQFRLRSFEPSDDWWFAVDNVVVDDVPAISGGSATLFSEGFDSGLGGMLLLSLAVPPNSGDTTWTTVDRCTRYSNTIGPFDGRSMNRLEPGFVILDTGCDPHPARDEYLATPPGDFRLYKSVYLHWRDEIVAVDNAVQEVLLSLDGGSSVEAEPIFSYNAGGLFDGDEEPYYARHVMSVPRAAGQSNVLFVFHYKGAGSEEWWAVDDVKVTATSICEVPFMASVGGPTTATVGDTVTLTATTNAAAPATYKWTILSGDGSIDGSSTGATVDVTSGTVGDLKVGLVVKDACGNSSPADATVAFSLAGGLQKPNDENQDGKMDISDAVAVLNYLFTGTNPTLPCGGGDRNDAGNIALLDSNGDGKIDLSDAVRLLGFLFLGDPRPPSCLTDACPCIRIVGCPEGPCTP